MRRNRGAVISAGLLFVALILGITGTTIGLIWAEQARQDAVVAQQAETERAEGERLAKLEAKAQTTKALDQLRIATAMRLAAQSQGIRDELPVQSLLLAREALETTRKYDGTILPPAHQSLRDSLLRIGGQPFTAHEGGIYAAATSPDGRWLVTGSDDTTVRLWDLAATNPEASAVVLRGHEDPVFSVEFSSDSRWLVTKDRGDESAQIRLWDLQSKNPRTAVLVSKGHRFRRARFSPDGRWLAATGGQGHNVSLWDLDAENLGSVRAFSGHQRHVARAIFTPDSRWLVTSSDDKTARLWDLHAQHPESTAIVLQGHELCPSVLAISPDSRWLFTANLQVKVSRVWDLHAKDPAASAVMLPGPACSATFSSDSRWLAAGISSTVRVWDLNAQQLTTSVIELKEKRITAAVTFSPDDRWLVTKDETGAVRLRDFDSNAPEASGPVLIGPDQGQSMADAVISSDSRWLVTANQDNSVCIWDLDAADPTASIHVLRGHERRVTAIRFSSDNRNLFTASLDNTVRCWELPVVDPAATVQAVAVSPDVKWRVVAKNNEVWLRDLGAEEPDGSAVLLGVHQSRVLSAAISPDGRWAITGGAETARLWDLQGEDVAASAVVLSDLDGPVRRLMVSPNSRWLVTMDRRPGRPGLWDLRSEDPAASQRVLQGFGERTMPLAFSPDSHWLVTVQAHDPRERTLGNVEHDTSIRLLDLTASDPEAECRVLRVHDGVVARDVSYSPRVWMSPDGRWLVSWNPVDETTRLWDLQANEPDGTGRVLLQTLGRGIAISPDSRWLVGTDARARKTLIWDLYASDPIASAVELQGNVGNRNAFSPDGRWLVTHQGKTVLLWDLHAENATGSANALLGHKGTALVMAFSPNSRLLITMSDEDKSLHLWNLQNPTHSQIVLQADDKTAVSHAVISPDGEWLATAGDDSIVRLVNLRADDPVAATVALRGHEGTVSAIRISPDGRWLISETSGRVLRWELSIERLLEHAHRKAGRQLSAEERKKYALP